MKSIILTLIFVAAGLVIASGIWVAIALLRTVSPGRSTSNNDSPTETRG